MTVTTDNTTRIITTANTFQCLILVKVDKVICNDFVLAIYVLYKKNTYYTVRAFNRAN